MTTIRCVVEYDGTNFCGLQYQPALRSVAGVLEKALSGLLLEDIKITAAGRTDAGVHASGQVISFKTASTFPIDRLPIAINTVLPSDLSLREAAIVDDRFSARFSARERTYIYLLWHQPLRRALASNYTHHVYGPLDLEPMREGARDLIGEHDFLSFCGALPDTGPTIRELRAIAIERKGDIVRVVVRGDGFLHRMVRITVGTLIEMGQGRRDPHSSGAILAARDRRKAGYTAPASGLYLAGVKYDDFDSFCEPPMGWQ